MNKPGNPTWKLAVDVIFYPKETQLGNYVLGVLAVDTSTAWYPCTSRKHHYLYLVDELVYFSDDPEGCRVTDYMYEEAESEMYDLLHRYQINMGHNFYPMLVDGYDLKEWDWIPLPPWALDGMKEDELDLEEADSIREWFSGDGGCRSLIPEAVVEKYCQRMGRVREVYGSRQRACETPPIRRDEPAPVVNKEVEQ